LRRTFAGAKEANVGLLQLIDEMERAVPMGAVLGTRWTSSQRVRLGEVEHELRLVARIDNLGRRREQYFCDGVRVEKALLLRLTCPETECPQARAVRAQWDRFHGRTPRSARADAAPRPLIEETQVIVGGQRCTARPARFSCFTACPHRAHPDLVIEKTGFDLFDNGLCIAGGLTSEGATTRPRLPTLQAAEAFVLARWLEAQATIERLKARP
jgi:hypothetical protein